MKTVKTYLVRKPSDLEEVMELTKRYGNEATEVKVAETIRLDEETYKARYCAWPKRSTRYWVKERKK